jgi:hypothetical protein
MIAKAFESRRTLLAYFLWHVKQLRPMLLVILVMLRGAAASDQR